MKEYNYFLEDYELVYVYKLFNGNLKKEFICSMIGGEFVDGSAEEVLEKIKRVLKVLDNYFWYITDEQIASEFDLSDAYHEYRKPPYISFAYRELSIGKEFKKIENEKKSEFDFDYEYYFDLLNYNNSSIEKLEEFFKKILKGEIKVKENERICLKDYFEFDEDYNLVLNKNYY